MGYYQLIIAAITLALVCWILMGTSVDDGGLLMVVNNDRLTAVLIPLFLFIIAAYHAITYFMQYRKPGMIIDETGITDYSNKNGIGFIPWQHITGIEKKTVIRRDFLLIHLSNPDEYIERVRNPFKRKGRQTARSLFGTPLLLSNRELHCTFTALEDELQKAYTHYKSK